MTNSKNASSAPEGFHPVWENGQIVRTETNEAYRLRAMLHTLAMGGTTWEPINDIVEPNDEQEPVVNS